MKEKLKINKLVQNREIGKMIKGKIILILMFFVLIVQPLFAENDLIKVSVDKSEVNLGSTITLTVEIDSKIANDYKMPKMVDFVVVPKKNFSKNGKKIYVYSLAPKAVGYYDIPEIVILDNFSKLIKIKVNEPDLYSTKSKRYSKSNESIHVEAQTDTSSLYVNQQLTYTLIFRTKFELNSNPSYTLPMFQDFWKSNPKVKSGYKLIDGENYFTFEVNTQLYPMKDGDIVIDPASVSVVTFEYGDIEKFTTQNEFENGKQIRRNLQTEPVKIKVYTLPENGKPENFSGAVGTYRITASLNKNTVVVNEPVNLNITITGDGNISSVIEPEIDIPKDIQKYATTYKVTNNGWQSTKTFKCVLIPLIDGKKIIPEISFSYFSPDSKEYVTIKTSKLELNVKEGVYDKNNNSVENVDNEQENNEDVMQNICELKTNIKISSYNCSLINNKVLLFFVISPFFILFIISLIYRLRIVYVNRDKVKVYKQKIHDKSMKYLRYANSALSKNNQNQFYFNINLSLRLYLQSKTNIDYVNMLKEDIKSELSKYKVSVQLIDSIEKVLIDCEFFKFTQAKSTNEYMEHVYDVVKNIIEQLDKFYEKNFD